MPPVRTPFLILVLAAVGCTPTPPPELTIIARPTEINDTGEVTTLSVTATDGNGAVGKGQVRISSTAGTLKEGGSFDLDAYGVVRTPYSCKLADDPQCREQVRLIASWTTDGQTATTDTHVTIIPPPPAPWEDKVSWDPGARITSCSGAGAPAAAPCTGGMCAHGFTCINDQCVLNGGGGGLQYTLRFNPSVDVDLHVVEPSSATDAGVCEVFWGAPSNSNRPTMCGALSSLDLDSNAACNLDNVNIENVIFPNNQVRPPPGVYVARVDLWSACTLSTPINWELQVRAGRISRYYCGTFDPMQEDRGGPMAGLTVSTIVIPAP